MSCKRQIYSVITDIFIAIPIVLVLITIFSINSNLAHGMVSGKYFWFYVSISLLSVFAIPASIIKRRERIGFKLPDLLTFMFCVAAVTVTVYHTGRLTNKCLLLIFVTVFYFYLRIFLSGKSKLIYYLCIMFFVITGLVEAVWGLMQLYGFSPSYNQLFKITGSLFNPGPYSGWLAIVFPMALGYAVFNHKENKITQSLPVVYKGGALLMSILCYLTVLCTLTILPAAMSRASWLAVLGGSAFIGIIYYIQNRKVTAYIKKNRKRIVVFSLVALILFAVSMSGLFLLKKNSALGRIFTWKIAIQTIKEHPMGVGLGNFAGNYGDMQEAYFASGVGNQQEEYVASNVEYAFNEYLQICIETGIIPFFVFVSLVIVILYLGIKKKNYFQAGSLVSLLIFASMSYPFNILPFVIAFVFLAILCTTDTYVNNDNNMIHFKGIFYPKFAIWIFIIIIPVTIVLCMYKIYPLYNAYKQWNVMRILYKGDMYEEASKGYAQQYPYLQDEIYFLFEYAQCLSKTKDYEKSNEILYKAVKISCDPMLYNIMGKNYQSLQQYELAEQNFRKMANIVPNRLYPHYLLAKLYHEMGLKDKMETEINIVLTKPPKVESMAVEEMRKELGELRTL